MAVTSMEEMCLAAGEQEITISGFEPGSQINVKVKKPNFFSLLAQGAVPNPLIPEMERLFVQRDRSGHAAPSEEFAKALVLIARLSLCEPSFEELQANGIELTDDQLTEISLFATSGAEALRTFRAAVRDGAGGHGQAVSNVSEQASANT